MVFLRYKLYFYFLKIQTVYHLTHLTYYGSFWGSLSLDCFFHKPKGGIIIKTKSLFSSLLVWVMTLSLLSGCSSQIATTDKTPPSQQQPQSGGETSQGAENSPVKTGLSTAASVSSSADAAGEQEGVAQSDITLVAVTVDEQGVIHKCVIDEIRCGIQFNTQGTMTTDPTAQFPSKNELGRSYGMHTASSIDKDWSEQAAAFARYAVGKTVDEVENMAISRDNANSNADLSASVTLFTGNFVEGIRKAVENAQHLGAQKGDDLKLVSTTDTSKSTSATGQEPGTAQADVTIAAVTTDGRAFTSCLLDGVQTQVSFDASGKITSDLNTRFSTKNELGRSYGMHTASSIDKDWSEQAAAFARYVTGKTPKDVAGIAVDEQQKPTQADLTTSVTLSIGDFQALLSKAGL